MVEIIQRMRGDGGIAQKLQLVDKKKRKYAWGRIWQSIMNNLRWHICRGGGGRGGGSGYEWRSFLRHTRILMHALSTLSLSFFLSHFFSLFLTSTIPFFTFNI